MTKKRLRDDPTLGLHRLNVEKDRCRERRPLTDEESQRLIATTLRSEREYKGLTGRDRATIYMLGQRTGLRRNELRTLKVGSFDLQSSPPVVQVDATNSKHGQRDILPLPDDVATMLRGYLADRHPTETVWPGGWWHRAAEMLRLDLADAGIEPRDAQGKVVDFHGQRMTYITALVRAGVPPAMAQKLARHSDINLTLGAYTRLPMADLASAVDMLSELRPSPQQAGDSTSAMFPARATPTENDSSLSRVVDAWDRLSEHVRQAILALIEGSSDDEPTFQQG